MAEPALTRIVGMVGRHREIVYGHAFEHLDREIGGVLVGSRVGDDTIWVRGVIPALEADEKAAAVTFTHDAWERIHTELDTHHKGTEIVGWYHSHPGFGIFLSRDDTFIHSNFFGEWWQFAYVVDPVAREEGVFVWRDGKLVEYEHGQIEWPPPGRFGVRGVLPGTRGAGS